MTLVPGPLEVEKRIHAAPEIVFSFFTDPEKYRRWMGLSAELDPRPGGTYRVDVNGRNVALGRYVELDPPRRIVLTFGWEGDPDLPAGASTVEIELVADGDDTIVRLRQSGLPTEGWKEQQARGWDHYLGRLIAAGAGRDPGPDPMVSA